MKTLAQPSTESNSAADELARRRAEVKARFTVAAPPPEPEVEPEPAPPEPSGTHEAASPELWDFVTVLESADDDPVLATKVFSGDPYGEPLAWSDGFFWNSDVFHVASFADLVAVIGREVLPHECRYVMLGRPKPGLTDTPHVRRKYDYGDRHGAPYEAEAQHRYLIGDWDKCPEPLDVNDIRGSVERARATLPELLRGAACAFFLSSNAHRKGTVRGKWIFPLDRFMSLGELKAHAKAFGFDDLVCQAVQPIYFANPVFLDCGDPLEGKRQPVVFEGSEVSLPAVAPNTPSAAKGSTTPREPREPAAEGNPTVVLMRPYWEKNARHPVNRAMGSWLAQRGKSDEYIASIFTDLGCDRAGVEHRVEQALEAAAQARTFYGPQGGRALPPNADGTPQKSVPRPPGWQELALSLGETTMRAIERIERVEENSTAKRYLDSDDPVRKALARMAENDDGAPADDGATFPDDHWNRELSDWTSDVDEPIDWYCRGLCIAPSDGKVTIIGGDPGTGKGPLASYLAVCFATGRDAFGDPRFACRKSRVAILDFEGARLTRRRVRQYARGFGLEPAALSGELLHRKCTTGDLEHLDGLEAWIRAQGVEVLIVDSYMSAMMGQAADPRDQKFASFAAWLGALGIAVIVVAHARKPESGKHDRRPVLADMAGSFALAGLAATGISVWRPDDEAKNAVRVGCMRAPDEAFATLDLTWTRDPSPDPKWWRAKVAGTVARAAAEKKSKDDERTTIAHNLVRRLAGTTAFSDLPIKTLARAVGAGEPRVAPILEELVRLGVARRSDQDTRGPRYWLGDVALATFDRIVFQGERAEVKRIGAANSNAESAAAISAGDGDAP